MSRLLDLQDKMRDTSAAIARFERVCAEDTASAAVALMLKSFEKRRRQLETELMALTAQIGVDVCSYKFFSETARATVAPVCEALSRFQSLYSIVYDAIKSGAKKRTSRLTKEVMEQSSFVFGHTFAGSLGIVMTIDDERSTLFGSSLDDAMRSLVELALSRTSNDILSRGKIVGVPAVRALHKWAASHIESSQGVEIEWRRGKEPMSRILLELSDLRRLITAIDETSEVIDEEIEIEARLAGADVSKRTFHLEIEGSPDIRGSFSSSVPPERTFEVGRMYRVTLRKRVRVYYSTEQEEDVSHQLLIAVAL